MLCENLYTLRKGKKLSQEQVAEAIGVTRQAVAKWEAGEALPDLTNTVALAKLYDITLDELVNFDSAASGGLPVAPGGKYMFGAVTVGEKGQIVIPVKARKIFGIKPGDSLVVLGDIQQGLALVDAQAFLDKFHESVREG